MTDLWTPFFSFPKLCAALSNLMPDWAEQNNAASEKQRVKMYFIDILFFMVIGWAKVSKLKPWPSNAALNYWNFNNKTLLLNIESNSSFL